eukprot:CAMPEP_0170355624 /NCGR_PEP_ID=MMETSP0117_2-20130122/741_1 /TAXON_ID=400756 /ORGANISM="Durinskia baltica, Strain CSIRO CS-38" /LENGTH=1335 /DNA_ID=CAMNT_0010609673 /DNA_START=108 /DNA_END=4115 /DNA_ORIENTATION=-
MAEEINPSVSISESDTPKQHTAGKPQPHSHFVVEIVSVSDIPYIEPKVKSDAYVQAFLAIPSKDESGGRAQKFGNLVRTPVRYDCAAAVWNSFRNFNTDPPPDSILTVELYHFYKDPHKSDCLLGKVDVPVKVLIDDEAVSIPLINFKSGLEGKNPEFAVTLRRCFADRPLPLYRTFFIIRHGQSKWNRAMARINLTGMLDRDHALTTEGLIQAMDLNSRWREVMLEENCYNSMHDQESVMVPPMFDFSKMDQNEELNLDGEEDGDSEGSDSDEEASAHTQNASTNSNANQTIGSSVGSLPKATGIGLVKLYDSFFHKRPSIAPGVVSLASKSVDVGLQPVDVSSASPRSVLSQNNKADHPPQLERRPSAASIDSSRYKSLEEMVAANEAVQAGSMGSASSIAAAAVVGGGGIAWDPSVDYSPSPSAMPVSKRSFIYNSDTPTPRGSRAASSEQPPLMGEDALPSGEFPVEGEGEGSGTDPSDPFAEPPSCNSASIDTNKMVHDHVLDYSPNNSNSNSNSNVEKDVGNGEILAMHRDPSFTKLDTALVDAAPAVSGLTSAFQGMSTPDPTTVTTNTTTAHIESVPTGRPPRKPSLDEGMSGMDLEKAFGAEANCSHSTPCMTQASTPVIHVHALNGHSSMLSAFLDSSSTPVTLPSNAIEAFPPPAIPLVRTNSGMSDLSNATFAPSVASAEGPWVGSNNNNANSATPIPIPGGDCDSTPVRAVQGSIDPFGEEFFPSDSFAMRHSAPDIMVAAPFLESGYNNFVTADASGNSSIAATVPGIIPSTVDQSTLDKIFPPSSATQQQQLLSPQPQQHSATGAGGGGAGDSISSEHEQKSALAGASTTPIQPTAGARLRSARSSIASQSSINCLEAATSLPTATNPFEVLSPVLLVNTSAVVNAADTDTSENSALDEPVFSPTLPNNTVVTIVNNPSALFKTEAEDPSPRPSHVFDLFEDFPAAPAGVEFSETDFFQTRTPMSQLGDSAGNSQHGGMGPAFAQLLAERLRRPSVIGSGPHGTSTYSILSVDGIAVQDESDTESEPEASDVPIHFEVGDLPQRREEYVRLFLHADIVYSSPLTRALQTALAAMCGHSALVKNPLTLYRVIREIKSIGGLDTVGIECGAAIIKRVKAELIHSLGAAKAEALMEGVEIDTTSVEQPWWTQMSSSDSEKDQLERVREFITFSRYCPHAIPVFVGHSLFFRKFYSKRVSKVMSRRRPHLSASMKRFKLSNATLLAVTVKYHDLEQGSSDAMILDADLLFGGGFHGARLARPHAIVPADSTATTVGQVVIPQSCDEEIDGSLQLKEDGIHKLASTIHMAGTKSVNIITSIGDMF